MPGTTKEDGGPGATECTCSRVLGSIEDQDKHGQPSWKWFLCYSTTSEQGPRIPSCQVPCLNSLPFVILLTFWNQPYICTATKFGKIYVNCQCHLTSKRSMVQLLPSIAVSLWPHSNSLRMVQVLLLRQGGPQIHNMWKINWSPFKRR